MTDNEPENAGVQKNFHIRYGIADVQGRRSTMEDAHITELKLCHPDSADKTCCFFGVYDGHGGAEASKYCSEHLHKLFIEKSDWYLNPLEHLSQAVAKTEENFLSLAQENQLQDGSTVAIAVFFEGSLYVANVGDSEVVLSSANKPQVLSKVHTLAKNEDEMNRVVALGGRVHNERLGHPCLNSRIFNLGVARSIGDLMYKSPEFCQNKESGLVADAACFEHKISDNDDFVLLACDGLWDVFEYEEAVEFVGQILRDTNNPQLACDELVKEAEINRDSTDNITAMVIVWREFK